MWQQGAAVEEELESPIKNIEYKAENNQAQVFTNTDANGNGWFIESFKAVETANEEMLALDSLNTKKVAVLNKNQFDISANTTYQVDSLANINLVDYKPNYLKYESNNTNNGFAVFSENYYQQGWQAYIDGSPVDHIRTNYILRAMKVPAGQHTIEFKFEPKSYSLGSTISLITSLLIVLGLLGFAGKNLYEKYVQSMQNNAIVYISRTSKLYDQDFEQKVVINYSNFISQ